MSTGSCLYELRRLSFKELRKLFKKLRQLFLRAKAALLRSEAVIHRNSGSRFYELRQLSL